MKLVQNLSWNFVGQVVAKASLLLFHIMFANLVGVEGYGAFSFVFVAGMILLQPILDLGLNQLVTKWVSRGNFEVIPKSFKIKGLVTILLIPTTFVLAWWQNINPYLYGTMLGFFLLNTYQQSLFGILRGLEDLRPESITIAFQNILACIFLGIIIVSNYTEPWVGSLVLMSTRFIGGLLITLILFKKFLKKLDFKKEESNRISHSKLWKEALTLGLVMFLIQFYFRIDTIMLGLLTSEKEVGFYNVAFNLMEGTFFIPTIVMAAIFPGLSITKQFSTYFRKGLILLSSSGVIVGVIVFVLSDWFFNIFYEPSIYYSAEILKILAITIPLVFLGYLMTQSLVALDHNRIYLVITALGVLLNILLNLWLIPEKGAAGAAIATVITEAIIPLACFVVILKHHFNRNQPYAI